MITAQHSLLVGDFGSVDGLNLIAQTADDPEIENATYNAWKEDHFISNVFTFLPKGISFLTSIDFVSRANANQQARLYVQY